LPSNNEERYDIFDVHQHVGTTVGVSIAGDLTGSDLPVEELHTRIRTMDEVGIRQAIVSPGHSYDRTDGLQATRRHNNMIAAYRDQTPDRFPIAAGVVEPTDFKSGLDEIDRISDELRLAAVSFHVQYQGVAIDDYWVLRYLERLQEHDMVPLVHAPDDTISEALWRLGKVARSLPDLTFLALEPFYTHESTMTCFFIAEVAPNVIFDTASCRHISLLEKFVNQFGAERVAYGSQLYSAIDTPGARRDGARSARILREEIGASSLSEDQKAAIFSGNARRVFSRFL
jgi:predicted TIM-barrel fold metal-dependent hydrolase